MGFLAWMPGKSGVISPDVLGEEAFSKSLYARVNSIHVQPDDIIEK